MRTTPVPRYFDIYVQGSLVYPGFNILSYAEQMYTACVLDVSNVARDSNNNTITVSLVPQQGMDGYGAAINGIEVVNP